MKQFYAVTEDEQGKRFVHAPLVAESVYDAEFFFVQKTDTVAAKHFDWGQTKVPKLPRGHSVVKVAEWPVRRRVTDVGRFGPNGTDRRSWELV